MKLTLHSCQGSETARNQVAAAISQPVFMSSFLTSARTDTDWSRNFGQQQTEIWLLQSFAKSRLRGWQLTGVRCDESLEKLRKSFPSKSSSSISHDACWPSASCPRYTFSRIQFIMNNSILSSNQLLPSNLRVLWQSLVSTVNQSLCQFKEEGSQVSVIWMNEIVLSVESSVTANQRVLVDECWGQISLYYICVNI